MRITSIVLISFILFSVPVNAAIGDIDIQSGFNITIVNNTLTLIFEKDNFIYTGINSATVNETKTFSLIRQSNISAIQNLTERCTANYAQEFASCQVDFNNASYHLDVCTNSTQDKCSNSTLQEEVDVCVSARDNYRGLYNNCNAQVQQLEQSEWNWLIFILIGAGITYMFVSPRLIKSTPEEKEFRDEGVEIDE